MTDEGSCTGLGGGVRQWNCFRPPGEAINDREEVLHALGFIEGPHQVDMEAAEATVRGWPLGERCLNMAVGLRCLARVTFSAPLTDVPFHSMPHEACSDGVLRWAAFRSRLEAINLIALFNCDLLCRYSLDDVLSPFINDLKQLDDISVTNMYVPACQNVNKISELSGESCLILHILSNSLKDGHLCTMTENTKLGVN